MHHMMNLWNNYRKTVKLYLISVRKFFICASNNAVATNVRIKKYTTNLPFPTEYSNIIRHFLFYQE